MSFESESLSKEAHDGFSGAHYQCHYEKEMLHVQIQIRKSFSLFTEDSAFISVVQSYTLLKHTTYIFWGEGNGGLKLSFQFK